MFIKNEISSGRYGSASEVVRDALRYMEERKSKLEKQWAEKCLLKKGSIAPIRSDDVQLFTLYQTYISC
ncbi:MAG: type II toxin-antitoxin system ParD family antitoxin [Halioglobus sp.]